jgi:hypothetical protein
MSELIQKNESHDFRWQLLAGTSVLALIGYIAAAPAAKAEDTDRPIVWIELGGQLSRWENSQEPYAPPFATLTPSNLSSPQNAEKPPRYGVDESAALKFQPTDSDWTFSASIRYGRSGNSKHARQQSNPAAASGYLIFRNHFGSDYVHGTEPYHVTPIAAKFADVVAKQSESHAILDFMAGKDVGLGLFGHNASSTLNFGVRFAQFTSRSSVKLLENPDFHFKTQLYTFSTAYTFNGRYYGFYEKRLTQRQVFHSFAGTFLANRSFTGLGPSISWDSSEPIVGNSERVELTFDWGANASLLFGRRKTKIHHQTTGRFYSATATAFGSSNRAIHPITYQRSADHIRSHGVIVPNVGGFAGFSVKYPNAKVSFGYKADFFFGAMDGGIDVRRTEDIGFHGPYASISIGLGG